MRWRLTVPMLALLLATSPTARAATFYGDGALWAHEMRLHAPGPAGAVTVLRSQCPEYPDADGCAIPDIGLVYITNANDYTLQHELGHMFDRRNLDTSERSYLLHRLAPPGTPWDPSDRERDPRCQFTVCPIERFADLYAACALELRQDRYVLHDGVSEFVSGWTPSWDLSVRRQASLCRAIRKFADPA